MKILTINAGYFKVDGGAMFGVVPKGLWQKLMPPDEHNMVVNVMRLLLIETEGHVILVDTGLGDKQDEKFFRNYNVLGERDLANILERKGYRLEDITDVILTHLHADHAGGAVRYDTNAQLVPTFPNATYWVSSEQWNNALNPNRREKAAFLHENFIPLKDFGVLNFVEKEAELFPNVFVHFHHGHTRGLIALWLRYKDMWVIYPSDFIPTAHHVYEPYIMSYDICAERTLKEKEKFFSWTQQNKHCIIFNHDPDNEAGVVFEDKKGHKIKETFLLSDFLG